MTTPDLPRALARLREWICDGDRRRADFSVDAGRVVCWLQETRPGGAECVRGSGSSGQYYHAIEAEIAHAITRALERAR